MQLTLENTTKGAIKFPGLELKPGKNELTPDQVKAWFALREKGTSRDLIEKRQPRWPALLVTMMAARFIVVTKASGADERDARRGPKKPAKSSAKGKGSSSSSR